MKARENSQSSTKATNKKASQNEQPDSQWQFHLEGSTTGQTDQEVTVAASKSKQNAQPVTWTASEFIAHQKTFLWYFGLALTAAVFAAIIYT